MTKCDYCGGSGAVGNPESPDSCSFCEVATVRFALDTIYGEWDAVATKWADGAVTVEVSRDAGSPYMKVTTEWEIVYENGADATPNRIAADIEERCEA